MNPIEFIAEETLIGTWAIHYAPPTGGLYGGKLTVTEKSIHFLANYNITLNVHLEDSMYVKDGSYGHLIIPKNRILKIETDKTFFHKKVILTLDNGQIHTFNNGIPSIDKVVEAISTK